MCSISTGKSNTQDKVDDGKYPFYVRSPKIERSNRYLYDEEAVLTVGDGVGTGKVFHYVNGKYDLHQRVYRMFGFSDDMSAKYFYHQFSKDFYDRVMSMTAKTSVDSVRFEMIADMVLRVPSLAEQVKIADCLDYIDTLITLHQCKYFSQNLLIFCSQIQVVQLRFPKAWEQRKWIEQVDISTEMVNPSEEQYQDMPHIAPGNIESFSGKILDNVKLVKEEKLISGKFRFRPDDVVYGKINPQLAKYFYATCDGLTSADAYVLNGKHGLTQKFLFTLLQTDSFYKYSVSVSKRSGMPKINREELNAFDFTMPSETEQTMIGEFLLNIDNVITLHQCK